MILLFVFFSVPIRYFIPIFFYNQLNKDVVIRTSLQKPFDVISATSNSTFRYVLRPLNPGRALIYAFEKDSGKRLLVNDKQTVSLLTNSSLTRYWPVRITEGRTTILSCKKLIFQSSVFVRNVASPSTIAI